MTTKVNLRSKAISGKRQSLYLDFYPPIIDKQTGKPTRREFLNIHVMDSPKSPIDKQANKDMLLRAEQIRLKRDNEINKPEVYSEYEKQLLVKQEREEQEVMPYLLQLVEKRKGTNYKTWKATSKYFANFAEGRVIKFKDITEKLCDDYREYLLSANTLRTDKKTLALNTASIHFTLFKATLNKAYKDGYIHTDINAKLPHIPREETEREYFTVEELNDLIKTKCGKPVLKTAALFSALTGLRYSDISKLTWAEVREVEKEIGKKKIKEYSLHFRQKKTGGVEMHPINAQAFQLMGGRKNSTDKVFDGLKYNLTENNHLKKWLDYAGIERHITFHGFRHSYATLLLGQTNDIYLTQKMLGHKKVTTTQIYAKLIDERKREAANSIKLKF